MAIMRWQRRSAWRRVASRCLALDAILEVDSEKNELPSKKATVRSFADVEHEAEMLREKWKLGLDPIPSLTGLLEDKGDCGKLEQPSRFERSVYWALADRLISLPHAAELLRRPVSQVELDFRGPPAGDPAHSQ